MKKLHIKVLYNLTPKPHLSRYSYAILSNCLHPYLFLFQKHLLCFHDLILTHLSLLLFALFTNLINFYASELPSLKSTLNTFPSHEKLAIRFYEAVMVNPR